MGERILVKSLREQRGMTQKQLSEKARVPRICIIRYETGRYKPGMKNAAKLAAALGVTIDELIGKAG